MAHGFLCEIKENRRAFCIDNPFDEHKNLFQIIDLEFEVAEAAHQQFCYFNHASTASVGEQSLENLFQGLQRMRLWWKSCIHSFM